MRGWALGDVPQADAVSLCLLEGLPQAPEDIRVILGRGEVAGVDFQGMERIGQHGFPCGLRHPLTRSPGGPGHGTLRLTRTGKQAGKALRSQGHHYARVM